MVVAVIRMILTLVKKHKNMYQTNLEDKLFQSN